MQLQKFSKLLEVLKLLLVKNQNEVNAYGILRILINKKQNFMYTSNYATFGLLSKGKRRVFEVYYEYE